MGVVAAALLALAGVAAPTAWSSAAPANRGTTQTLADVVADRAKTQVSAACYHHVVITSHTNARLVSAELGYGGDSYGMLRARATAIGPWERFTVCFNDWHWTIQSQANDRYVSAELGYGGDSYAMLRARATAVGPWERFSLNYCGQGCTTITSQANDQLVSAEMGYGGDSYGMLRARATALGPWERFSAPL
ncbi:hypothetical protein SMD11_6539 [Streptomyces albireticuli]|uniref:Uncharacterized protein n=1 Tax=Streptomyces albireticuli TaxID=1940 RepID=A0A1Z2LCW1_9ACTN|nr:hypothetical protein SMD11_6539 [Streptomyces albireticuli]